MVTRVPITYTNLDGKSVTENFYFNLSKAEVAEWEMEVDGGLSSYLEKLQALSEELEPKKDSEGNDIPFDQNQLRDLTKKISSIVKDVILRSYGEKSPDGRRFVKSKELSESFYQTDAYSELYVKLMTNPVELTEFIKAILPDVPAEGK